MWRGRPDSDWLKILIEWIVEYNDRHPENHGEYKRYSKYGCNLPTTIPIKIRQGIVFYSRGWGWRLRENYKTVLYDRKKELR